MKKASALPTVLVAALLALPAAGQTDEPIPLRIGPGSDRPDQLRMQFRTTDDARTDTEEREHARKRWRRHGPTIVIVREREAEPAADEAEPPETPPAEAEAPAAPVATSPDPTGPGLTLRARGSEESAARWRVGEALPPDQPVVTLSARRYGLPPLPAGESYVRIGRDVLQINAITRVVIAQVEPEG